MVVPDFELIAEIMLVAEGFIEARILARKFLTLYTLCKDLLSKQLHYDWGLRAIKSVLVVAGSLKRGDRGRPEEQVCEMLPYSGNLSRLKTNFTVLEQFVKVLTAKILIECGINGCVNNNGRKLPYPQTIVFHNSRNLYLRKSDSSAICESFHPQKRFLLYFLI